MGWEFLSKDGYKKFGRSLGSAVSTQGFKVKCCKSRNLEFCGLDYFRWQIFCLKNFGKASAKIGLNKRGTFLHKNLWTPHSKVSRTQLFQQGHYFAKNAKKKIKDSQDKIKHHYFWQTRELHWLEKDRE